MDDFVVSDAITDLERSFPFKELLELDYFQKYRGSYYRCNDEGRQIPNADCVPAAQGPIGSVNMAESPVTSRCVGTATVGSVRW